MSSSDVDDGGTYQTMYVGEESFLLLLHLVLRRPVHGGGRDEGRGVKGEGYREEIWEGVHAGREYEKV